jgi:hypothetical protein
MVRKIISSIGLTRRNVVNVGGKIIDVRRLGDLDRLNMGRLGYVGNVGRLSNVGNMGRLGDMRNVGSLNY